MLATSDIPMGWSTAPRAPIGTAPAYDNEPRLVRGAAAASELVQLCGVWSRDLHPADATVEPKIDGHRCLYLGGDDDRLLSRGGSAMGCAAHSLPSLRRLEARFGQPMMFDGEWTVPGGLNETLRAFRRNRPAAGGVFWLFDAIPLRDWRRGRSLTTLGVRKAAIARVFPEDGLCGAVGRVLDFPMDADQTEILARSFWRQRYEGLVVKDRNALYIRGRNNGFLKLKQGD